jgi:hypothetical protein
MQLAVLRVHLTYSAEQKIDSLRLHDVSAIARCGALGFPRPAAQEVHREQQRPPDDPAGV